MGSILKETKQSLGLDADAVGFDPELILFINATIAEMTQLGLGPSEGFAIADAETTWEEFLGDDPRFNNAKSYMHLNVKLLFDPPTIGFVLSAMKNLRDETVWRLNVTRETIVYPVVVASVPPSYPIGDDVVPPPDFGEDL